MMPVFFKFCLRYSAPMEDQLRFLNSYCFGMAVSLPTFVIICHVSHVASHHVNEELQERISCQAIELRQKDFELKKTTEDLDRAQAR